MYNSNTLYHYTNLNGLTGIMDNSSLWSTRSIFSNDIQDSKYIKSILIKVLKSYTRKEYKPFIKTIYHAFAYAEEECLTALKCTNEIFEKYFIISFSNKRDSRFFWDAYTQNTGFNLKFNKTELVNFFNSYEPNVYFKKFINKSVIYNEEEEIIILKKIIEQALKYYNFYGNKKNNYFLTRNVIKKLQYEAPFFKHPFWKEEKEYRFAFFRKYNDISLNSIKFNTKPKYEGINSNQAYIDLPIDLNLIQRIIIGPCNYTNIDNLVYKYEFLEKYKFQKSKGYGVVRKFIV
ncbi:DUF2971 domain-containing protein [Clostridium sp. DL1XJH146]